MPFSRSCLALLCLSFPAAAQEAFTWHYDAVYPIDPAQTALNLVATQPGSAPDTAAGRLPGGLIWARCTPFESEGNVTLRFEAFPVSALAFDAYAFQINDGAGTVLTLQAPLVSRETDQPTGGLEVIVPHDGPVLDVLGSVPVVTYGIVGFTDFQYPFDLTGNQALVTRFADDCGALTADLAGQGSAPDLPVAPVALVPELGPDITGHVWTRLTLVDEGNPANTQVSMGYAVPESDDIVIAGECLYDAEDPMVLLQVTADVAGMRNGDPVDLRASIPDGRTVVLNGNVVGVDAEFGIGGFEFVTSVSDPAWLVIAGDRTVRFDRPDSGIGLTVSGNGPNTIGPFLADCAEIARLSPESGGRPVTPIEAPTGYLACDNFGRVSSRDTGASQVVNFINATDSYRVLSWIDPQANVVDVVSLDPGEASAYTTDPGHIWMATDGLGNCLEMMQVPAGITDYPITAISQ